MINSNCCCCCCCCCCCWFLVLAGSWLLVPDSWLPAFLVPDSWFLGTGGSWFPALGSWFLASVSFVRMPFWWIWGIQGSPFLGDFGGRGTHCLIMSVSWGISGRHWDPQPIWLKWAYNTQTKGIVWMFLECFGNVCQAVFWMRPDSNQRQRVIQILSFLDHVWRLF